jgi:toxin ParE1/3/4
VTYNLIIPEQARQDLKDITKYIADDSPIRARSFIKELKTYFEDRLKQLPLSGKAVKGLVRMLPYKRYIILYIVDENKKLVKILNIFAGGRDWESFL